MTIYSPPDSLQIHLTGQAELDFLHQNGTSPEELDECLESWRKLRKEWKQKLTNAQNYQCVWLMLKKPMHGTAINLMQERKKSCVKASSVIKALIAGVIVRSWQLKRENGEPGKKTKKTCCRSHHPWTGTEVMGKSLGELPMPSRRCRFVTKSKICFIGARAQILTMEKGLGIDSTMTQSHQMNVNRCLDRDTPLPSFTGEGIRRKREIVLANISRIHAELVSSRVKILELGQAAFSIGANHEEYAAIRSSVQEAASQENENRLILQREFEDMDTLFSALSALSIFLFFATLGFMEKPSKSDIASSHQPANILKGESHLIRLDYATVYAIKENHPITINYDYGCTYLSRIHTVISLTSDTDLSSDEELWNQLEDLESQMASVHRTPASSICSTCRPQVFDGQVSGVAFKPKRWYNVYTGASPGIYTTWADASGRVLGVSNARHESFKTYDEALHAWKQNCLGHHDHPNDFIDNTIYRPLSPLVIPQASPPPAHPMTPLPASSRAQLPQAGPPLSHHQIATSSLSSPLIPPISPSRKKAAHAFSVQTHLRLFVNVFWFQEVSRGRWYYNRGGFVSIYYEKKIEMVADISRETADLIRREAHMRAMPALVREVDSIQEAEEWLSRLDLQSEASSGEPPEDVSYLVKQTLSATDSALSPAPMIQPPESNSPPGVSNSHPEVAATDQGLDTTAKPVNVSIQSSSQEKLTKGQKRGNQGNFSGVYLQHLEENSAAYVSIKKKRAQMLWHTEFISSWFKEWPWHTNGVPEEFEIIELIPKPSATDPFAVELVSFESTGLSREEYDELVSRRDNERAKWQEEGRQQITNWFHRAKQKSSSNASVFSGLLKQICNVGQPPRLTAEFRTS
ncbi:hypothetical protein K435DRAFT_805644 [Dendrothele bispora CBS 962.96]|uniref:Ribonuclease H1 N-terminal domain-containing protein n=1 Tax=Dendrothele bispora (strain CBS 962.96) TaxID=1314807 RepID=A0A4S8LAW0_DENBC|nr:hypothetical protein K435DRAFT_805644 [Dendrothele bispora CBS 962.96]